MMFAKSLVPLSVGGLTELSYFAQRADHRRQHRNLHDNFSDPCQRFLNAIGPTSYIRPHRHATDPKVETLIALIGRFALIRFRDEGVVAGHLLFGSEAHFGAGIEAVGVEVPPATWHTVIALSVGAVLIEMKAGPFLPDEAKEPAPWAPEEGTVEAQRYLDHLRARVTGEASSVGNPCGDIGMGARD